MGEETEKFTPEELKILGEEPPAQPTGAPEKPPLLEGGELKPPEEVKPAQKAEEVKLEEQTPEEKQVMESMGLRIEKGYILDDDGTKIPAKRWKSLYRDSQEDKRGKAEIDRKYNLLKELGTEKYYEIYPDEAPAGWKPPEKDNGTNEGTVTTPSTQNMGEMVVQGGPHNGKTLNEVWKEDPAYAASLQNQYLDSDRKKVEMERQTSERLKKESEDEVSKLTADLAKELFGKEPEKLNPGEEKEVMKTIQSVFDWMAKTNRGGAILADAFFLMNREKHLTDAKTKGGKEALESLKRSVPGSITAGGGSSVGGLSAYEGMTPDELAVIVDKMSDKEALKFLKEAPSALKAKYPSIPWS